MTQSYQNEWGVHALDQNILIDCFNGTGVESGCEATHNNTLKIDISSGVITISDEAMSIPSQSITLSSGNSNPRKDVIYIDTSGTVQVAQGTPESPQPSNVNWEKTETPEPESMFNTDGVVIAEVYIPSGAGSISSNEIRDRRNGPANFGAIGGGFDAVCLIQNGVPVAFGRDGSIIDIGGPDESVVQSAIDTLGNVEGGRVYIDDTMTVTSTITLKNGVMLQSKGKQFTALKADDGLNSNIIEIPNEQIRCEVKDMLIDGNKFNNSSGNSIVIEDDNYKPAIKNVTILDSANNGIVTNFTDNGGVFEPYLSQVDVNGASGDGIVLGDGTNNYVFDVVGDEVYVQSCSGTGIKDYSNGGNWYHVHSFNNGEYGMLVGPNASGNWYHNAYIETNELAGMFVDESEKIFVISAHAFDNSQAGAGQHSGIELNNAKKCFVSNLYATNFPTTNPLGQNTQEYGVEERGASPENNIVTKAVVENQVTGKTNIYGSGSQTEYIL